MKLSPADQEKRAEEIRRREIQGDREAAESVILRLPRGDLLLGYQQRTVDLLFAGTALLVIEKSRRIGLTWGVASFAALKAASAVNPFALAQARTRQALELTHGTQAGKIITLSAPSCALGRLTGYEQSQNIVEWPLPITPLPVNGDDQWTITLT